VIRNLLSIFDPITEINNHPLNWTRTTIGLLLIPTRIWLIPSRNNIIISLLINKLHQEIKAILRKGNENKGNYFILTSLFLIILMNNFLGLFINRINYCTNPFINSKDSISCHPIIRICNSKKFIFWRS
jgi:hypothetical protein